MRSTTPLDQRHRARHLPPSRPRFLSEAEGRDIIQRLARAAEGGGFTAMTILSTWRGNIRWARNLVSTSGEVRNNAIQVTRDIHGAANDLVQINETTTATLVAAARRAERIATLSQQKADADLVEHYPLEPASAPDLFFDTTYQQDAGQRAAAARQLAQVAAAAGMLSAGYIEVTAHSQAILDTFGRARYFQYTTAQYSVTVRDPHGTGSGWAGVDNYDWRKVDPAQLSAIALEKCLRSRNPVAIEPGRYVTILEPQAVCDVIGPLFSDPFNWDGGGNIQVDALAPKTPVFRTSKGNTLIGQRVVDERISVGVDPMDPALGCLPFAPVDMNFPHWALENDVYHAAVWIDRGVLTNLSYDRSYARSILYRDTGLPNPGAFRMSVTGPQTPVDEMIATTKRGVLVTRFEGVTEIARQSQLYRGYTRDGLWLIENGKISKAVKNFAFTESVLFALNNVDQLGVPQRVFQPQQYQPYSMPEPVIVPALKIRDFSFTALTDAI